jgi:hypothetical protein
MGKGFPKTGKCSIWNRGAASGICGWVKRVGYGRLENWRGRGEEDWPQRTKRAQMGEEEKPWAGTGG